jgi:hypothetical protein
MFYLLTLKFYQIHALFRCPRKQNLPLPHRCRDEFLKSLPLPRHHRHRGSGAAAVRQR